MVFWKKKSGENSEQQQANLKSGGSSERWNIGDRIADHYEIHQIKKGGMGIVYLCYDHEFKNPVAIKTFQDRYLADKASVDRFMWEAETWVRLEKHKNIVRAHYVQNISERPYIFLEYVPGDMTYGSDLTGWIWNNGLDLNTTLSFAIQFCLGMEHAERKFREMGKPFVHRDIKPGNIMVTQDKVVKVTDFGLVKTFMGLGKDVNVDTMKDESTGAERCGFSMVGNICGTPPYMSPEQCKGEDDIDIRSDIYSFGCVLYEMLTGKRPFKGPTSVNYMAQHLKEKPTPPIKLVSSIPESLNAIVMKCLEKEPAKRYQSFMNMRECLTKLYFQYMGNKFNIEETQQELEAWEHNNKGVSFWNLGLYDESINECKLAVKLKPYDGRFHYSFGMALHGKGLIDNAIHEYKEALILEPDDSKIYNGLGAALRDKGFLDEAIKQFRNALKLKPEDVFARNSLAITLKDKGLLDEAISEFRETLKLKADYTEAHYNIGNAFFEKGTFDEAILEYKEALRLNPHFVKAIGGLGNVFHSLGRFKEAIQYFDKAIDLAPQEFSYWSNKGNSLNSLCCFNEAIGCFDKAIKLNPQNATTWANKGFSLENRGQIDEALQCYDKAIELNHEQADNVWNIKGTILDNLQRFDEAIGCFDKAIGCNPKNISAWINKGNILDHLGNTDGALFCYEKAIKLNPLYIDAWYNKGVTLMNLGSSEEAIGCFEESIRCYDGNIERKSRCAAAWLNKALIEERVGRFQDAIRSYTKFIEVAPLQYARHVAHAQERVHELNRK